MSPNQNDDLLFEYLNCLEYILVQSKKKIVAKNVNCLNFILENKSSTSEKLEIWF